MPEDISKEAKEKLGLEKLTKVNEEKLGQKYFFLSLGSVKINYKTEFIKGGSSLSQEARMAGADNDDTYRITGVSNSYLAGNVPKEATHYCLGNRIFEEEIWSRERRAHASEQTPIVFLKKKSSIF